MTTEIHVLKTLDDLRPAPYNPREIEPASAMGLRQSLKEFGDLSGITWNRRSGHLVAGHQRLDQLKHEYGDKLTLKVEKDRNGTVAWLETPSGDTFAVRVVDWDDVREKAANLAANNPAIAGFFTPDVGDLLEEINENAPHLVDNLLLDQITVQAPELEDEDDELDVGDVGDGPADMELQPFEHYDYVLVLARTTQDWEWLCERLKLSKVNSSPIAGAKKIGLGRAVDASRLIAIIEKLEEENRVLKSTKVKKEVANG